MTHPLLRRTTLLFGLFVAAVFAPIVLERVALLTRTYKFDETAIHIVPQGLAFRPIASEATLALFELALMVVSALLARSVARSTRESQERLAMQAWHLRQLLPDTPTDAA